MNFVVPGGVAGGVYYYGQNHVDGLPSAYDDPGNNYWNPWVFNGTTAAATNSDAVTASPITLTDNTLNDPNHGLGGNNLQGPVDSLEDSFAYASYYSTVTNTLNNVSAGTYDLYLYGKNGDQGGAYSGDGTIFTVCRLVGYPMVVWPPQTAKQLHLQKAMTMWYLGM